MRKLIFITLLSALPFAAPAAGLSDPALEKSLWAQHQARHGEVRQVAQLVRASDLIGMEVKNAEGESLGEIQDLGVEINHNRVQYLLLDAEDMMFAYPFHAFRFPAGSDHVLLNGSAQRIENAPRADPNKAGNESFESAVTLASDLLALVLASPAGDQVGDIVDVVIDLTRGTAPFVLAEFGVTQRAVPLSDVSFQSGAENLVLTLSEDSLGAERGLSDEQMFGALGNPVLIVEADRYILVLAPFQPGALGPAGRPAFSIEE
jgi:sporulation protein YlmC with PRC-barrel domain